MDSTRVPAHRTLDFHAGRSRARWQCPRKIAGATEASDTVVAQKLRDADLGTDLRIVDTQGFDVVSREGAVALQQVIEVIEFSEHMGLCERFIDQCSLKGVAGVPRRKSVLVGKGYDPRELGGITCLERISKFAQRVGLNFLKLYTLSEEIYSEVKLWCVISLDQGASLRQLVTSP